MTDPRSLDEATSFPEFWTRYQELHAGDESRAAHAVGTLAAAGVLGLAIARRSWRLALAAPMIDRAIARLGDSVDARREAHETWFHKPHWHLRAEWRLLRQTVREYRRRARIKRRDGRDDVYDEYDRV